MRKNSKGNLLLTFIMVVALSMTVFAFLAFIGVRLKESGIKVSEIESFYVAEAGLNKAIWYLGTPTGSGGRGLAWRVASTWEAFGWGGFFLTVMDHATNEVLVISTGEVSGITKTVSQVLSISGLPAAFDYAVYCGAGVNFTGTVAVRGDVYMKGDSIFGKNSSFTEGYVYHPEGTTLSGKGTWTDGGAPDPDPNFPTFDPTYYDNLITAAYGAAEGDQIYEDTTINLNGGTIYVNGDVTISGNTTINGPGEIIATGTISQTGNTYTSSAPKFISQGDLYVAGNAYTTGSTYYSATHIIAEGNIRVDVGSMLSKGSVALAGNLNLSGVVFSNSGTSVVSGNPVIRGALVANSFGEFTGDVNVYFDESKFPSTLPTGFASSSLAIKAGTWKGN
ncbi:MAG: hypothetical protein ABH860_02850 [bacterium]